MLTDAMTGSTSCAGEGGMSWCIDPDNAFQNNDPSLPLKEEPTEFRRGSMAFTVRYAAALGLVHSSLFALKKNGNIVAGAVMLPPNAPRDLSLCDWIAHWDSVKPIHNSQISGPSSKRFMALTSMMEKQHKKYASVPHWYLYVFASSPKCQGKGYGRELLTVLTNIADNTGHPIYLETMGPRNERFYNRNGFITKERKVLEVKATGEKMDVDGGMIAMVRPAPT